MKPGVRTGRPWMSSVVGRWLAALGVMLLLTLGMVPVSRADPGGTVHFSNRVLPGLDAPVIATDGTPLAGPAYVAQLYAAPTAEVAALVPVGAPCPFRTGAGAGYWNPGADSLRIIPFVEAGQTAYVQVRIWEVAFGGTFEEAQVAGGGIGMSAVLAVVTGGWGAPPSLPATLVGLTFSPIVRPARPPQFVLMPESVMAYQGTLVTLTGLAIGEGPVGYDWLFNGEFVLWAFTNQITFRADSSSAGDYLLLAHDIHGSRTSSVARVTVVALPDGGLVDASNHRPADGLDAPIYAANGVTRLEGTNYLAQIWGGRSADLLEAITDPLPFLTGERAGYFQAPPGSLRAIPGVAAGQTAYVQVRVWDVAFGESYELARDHGGHVGASEILEVVTGGIGTGNGPTVLSGLTSFRLDTIARIEVVQAEISVAAGRPATLQVNVHGAGPWLCQWYFESTPIPGANTQRLILEAITPDQAGTYRLHLTNPAGLSVSDPIRVTVTPQDFGGTVNFANRVFGDPDMIVDAPVFDLDGVTPVAGTEFVAQLFAGPDTNALAASGPPTVFRTGAGAGYWFPQTVVLQNVGPGALAFVQARVWEASQGYWYEAVETGKFGQSAVVPVVTGGVGSPPSFPANLVGLPSFALGRRPILEGLLVDQTVFVGQTVTWTMAVESHGPTALQWWHNGVPIPGATSPQLVLEGVNPDHSGTYLLTASNEVGGAYSREARLGVLEPPAGGSLRFSNRLPGSGLDAPVFAADGVTRLSGSRYLAQLYAGPNTNELAAAGSPVPFLTGANAGYFDAGSEPWRVLEGYQPGDTVTVEVRVWDGFYGSTYEEAHAAGGATGVSDAFQVVVGGPGYDIGWPAPLEGLKSFQLRSPPPVIVWQPVGLTTWEGEPISLRVGLTNAGIVLFVWEFSTTGNLWLPLATNTTELFTLSTATVQDSGLYRVQVSNTSGAAFSQPAQVIVRPKNELGALPGHVTLTATSVVPEGYTIEASTNRHAWEVVGDAQSAGQQVSWIDPAGASCLKRFYRLRSKASGAVVSAQDAGFVRITVPAGFSMFANPLRAPTNTVGVLLTGLPVGTTVYAFDPVARAYSVNTFEFGSWALADQRLDPGQGVLIYTPGDTGWLVTVSGEVEPPGPRTVPTGWTVQAAAGPAEGPLDTALQFPVDHLDIVARLTPDGDYDVYVADGTQWFPEPPVIGLGEAFWSWKPEAAVWDLPQP